ncbi:hypothetical protein ABVT39_023267 [Epinephelus coioides]
MENTEKSTEQATSTACTDLENILKGLDSLSNCMDQLACMYNKFIPIHSLHTSKMSVSINYASKMTFMIDLQICKAHDVTVTLDLKCDSQKWIIVHQLLLKLASLVDVSGAALHDAT